MNAKPDKRRCVYCGHDYTTITGRLCCLPCKKLSIPEKEAKFDELVRNYRQV